MEELRYFKKQLFQFYGILPTNLDNQDYFSFMNMLNAKEPDKRPGDPLEIAKQMGLTITEKGD